MVRQNRKSNINDGKMQYNTYFRYVSLLKFSFIENGEEQLLFSFVVLCTAVHIILWKITDACIYGIVCCNITI